MTRKFPDNPLLGPRDEYITANYPLVISIAASMRSRIEKGGLTVDDAIGEGSIGLIKAYDNYSDNKYAFSTFATSYIRGYIQNSMRDRGGSGLNIPRITYELIGRIYHHNLADEQPETIASALGISKEDAAEALRCLEIRKQPESIHAEEFTERSGVSDDYSGPELDELIATIPDERLRKIARMLAEGHTQAEIARSLEISRTLAGRLVKRIGVHLKLNGGADEYDQRAA